MRIIPTELPEVLIVEPTVHRDDRGFFLETWHERRYADAGLDVRFVQDNHSRSRRGTLRGLHAQLARPQGKLVHASRGEIFDVAVDIRLGSPRFGRWVGLHLSAENFRQLWVPEGFAHGFLVLSDEAEIQYKCTDFYDPSSELTIAWDDPALAISWPSEGPSEGTLEGPLDGPREGARIESPLLSAKDRAARRLAQFAEHELPRWRG